MQHYVDAGITYRPTPDTQFDVRAEKEADLGRRLRVLVECKSARDGARLESAGMSVVGTSSDEFARMVKDDIETFRRIVSAAGIKPE